MARRGVQVPGPRGFLFPQSKRHEAEETSFARFDCYDGFFTSVKERRGKNLWDQDRRSVEEEVDKAMRTETL